MGIANANVAKMVIDDINARGGLLGRPVELFIEDSATEDSVAEAAAAKLVDDVQVDVVVGGIYSSTRQAIKGPAVDQGKKLYIYPEQYEGQECHPLIFCTGLGQLRNSSAVDARADVYSLGVVLYECLSGRKPFLADTIGDLVYALCSG